jgi:hypothetical protein
LLTYSGFSIEIFFVYTVHIYFAVNGNPLATVLVSVLVLKNIQDCASFISFGAGKISLVWLMLDFDLEIIWWKTTNNK